MKFSICLKLFGSIAVFLIIASCGAKKEDELEVRLMPKDSLVLEFNAYSCLQILEGIRTIDGFVTPAIAGPVVQFNKMTLKWKKNTKLYIHYAKMKFRGAGIAGGETKCDFTNDLPSLFESTEAANTGKYTEGAIQENMANQVISSNPRCRIACSIPLADPDYPEIAGSGELTVKASEVTNEGKETEKYFRVKSRFKISIQP